MPATLSVRRALPAAAKYLRELWRRRDFAIYLALANLKARNASTALGLFWWILNPLLLAAVYAFVFGFLFPAEVRGDEPSYIAYLLSGIFPFYYTRSAMVGGVNSIVSNTKLLANLSFPRLVLPLSALIESFFGFIVSLPVFFLILGPVAGVWPTSAVVFLIPAIAIQTVFNFGLSTLVARVSVPFRDLNNLVPYFLRLWLYLSPIIYPITFFDKAPEVLRDLLRLNPLFSMLAVYRKALLGSPLDGDALLTGAIWATVLALLGVAWFVSYEGRMAKDL